MTTHTPDPIPPASGDLEAARDWLRKRWSQEWPNEGHVKQLSDYAAHLAALRPAVVGEAVAWRMMTYKGRELALQGKPFDSAYQAMMERDCGVTVQPLYTTPACHDVPEPDAVERAEANQAIWVEIAEERKVKLDALIARVREYARWVSSQMHNLPRCATADAVNERSRALLADLDAGVGL